MVAHHKLDLLRDVLQIIDDETSRELLSRLKTLSAEQIDDMYNVIMSKDQQTTAENYLKYVKKTEQGVEELHGLTDKLSLTQELRL
jgi:heme oxygenase